MLDACGDTVYINEPLNPSHPPGNSPGLLRAPVRHRYQYICPANEQAYLEPYRELLRLRYDLFSELREHHSPLDVAIAVRYVSNFLRGRARGRRPLIADPFAVFSAEWFARTLGCKVVVVMRHPAATISSRKRLGWWVDPSDFLEQPLLMGDRLSEFRNELEKIAHGHMTLLEQGSILWRAIYAVVDELRLRTPNVLLVRHEDLSLEPLSEFARVYAFLELPFNGRSKRAIERSTSSDNPAELAAGDPYRTRLDSRTNVDNWKHRLSPDEVARIHSLTAEVASRHYSAEDWVVQ